MKLIYIILLLLSTLFADNIYKTTTKNSCIQQSVHCGKSLAQQKKLLIEQAKQESLEELYGTLIFSKTDLKNGKITNNEVRSRAVGSVRVQGDPKFYNGKNLGEICTEVKSYITYKDIKKYTPKEVKLKRFCYNNPNAKIADIKTNANYDAYKKVITQYKPTLKNISNQNAAKLIHGFKKSNEDLSNIAMGLYCFDAVATVLPYEFEMTQSMGENSQNFIDSFDESTVIPGITATFYHQNDYKLKKPIYQTHLDTFDLARIKLPINHSIKVNTPYRVKLQGYYKSNYKKTIDIKMYADVYSANLLINDKQIHTFTKKYKVNHISTKLKKGYNKVTLIIKTANRYDVRLLGDINDIYTNKLKR